MAWTCHRVPQNGPIPVKKFERLKSKKKIPYLALLLLLWPIYCNIVPCLFCLFCPGDGLSLLSQLPFAYMARSRLDATVGGRVSGIFRLHDCCFC